MSITQRAALVRKIFVVLLTVTMVGVNCFYLLVNVMVRRKTMDEKILEPGTQFQAFEERLRKVKEVGYLTNKDMSEEHNDGEFLQAQYILAPTVLKLNETDPDLNILDFANPMYVIFTLRRIEAQPIFSSPYGKVLAQKETLKHFLKNTTYMFLFPFLFSILTGYCLIRLIEGRTSTIHIFHRLGLGLFLGLGVNASLIFYSLLIGHGYHRWLVIFLNGLLIAGLVFLVWRKYPPTKQKLLQSLPVKKRMYLLVVLQVLIYVVLTGVTIFVASRHPFGEWDAWALWNMKMRFILLSGPDWLATFQKLHWHTQPDYPFLLPLINIWQHTLANLPLTQTPYWTGIVLAISSSLLLYGALRQWIPNSIAFCAAWLLMASPFFIFLATAQYADVVLAGFLLASLSAFYLLVKDTQPRFALLLGLFLGLMTFVKNEGIVMTLILTSLGSLVLLSEKEKSWQHKITMIGWIVLGILITGLPTIIFKIWIAPANRDVMIPVHQESLPYFNKEGLSIVWNAFVKEWLHKRWCWIWVFLGTMMVLGLRTMFGKRVRALTLFFAAYFAVLLLVYLTTKNFDLAWRLKSSVSRILFYLLPSLVFWMFITHFDRNPKTSSSHESNQG